MGPTDEGADGVMHYTKNASAFGPTVFCDHNQQISIYHWTYPAVPMLDDFERKIAHELDRAIPKKSSAAFWQMRAGPAASRKDFVTWDTAMVSRYVPKAAAK